MADINLGPDFGNISVNSDVYAQAVNELQADIAALKAAGKSGEDLLPPVREFMQSLREAALPQPSTHFDSSHASNFYALPSPGARMLAMITEAMDEQRRLANQARVEQTLSTVSQLKTQATEIRNNAATQLAIGIVSSTVKLAAAGVTTGMSIKNLHMSGQKLTSNDPYVGKDAPDVDAPDIDLPDNLNKNLKPEIDGVDDDGALPLEDLDDVLTDAATDAVPDQNALNTAERARIDTMQARNITLKAINDGIMAGAGALDATKGFLQASFDARMKELDAEIEMSRALTQQMQGFEESFKTVLRKAIDTQNAIQQNTNQTRTRILG